MDEESGPHPRPRKSLLINRSLSFTENDSDLFENILKTVKQKILLLKRAYSNNCTDDLVHELNQLKSLTTQLSFPKLTDTVDLIEKNLHLSRSREKLRRNLKSLEYYYNLFLRQIRL